MMCNFTFSHHLSHKYIQLFFQISYDSEISLFAFDAKSSDYCRFGLRYFKSRVKKMIAMSSCLLMVSPHL